MEMYSSRLLLLLWMIFSGKNIFHYLLVQRQKKTAMRRRMPDDEKCSWFSMWRLLENPIAAEEDVSLSSTWVHNCQHASSQRIKGLILKTKAVFKT